MSDEPTQAEPAPYVNRFEFTITAEAEVIKAGEQPEPEEEEVHA